MWHSHFCRSHLMKPYMNGFYHHQHTWHILVFVVLLVIFSFTLLSVMAVTTLAIAPVPQRLWDHPLSGEKNFPPNLYMRNRNIIRTPCLTSSASSILFSNCVSSTPTGNLQRSSPLAWEPIASGPVQPGLTISERALCSFDVFSCASVMLAASL